MSKLPSHYGPFGGRYVAETLMPALDELEQAFTGALADPEFVRRHEQLRADYVGRPTPLYLAENLSRAVGYSVWLKREDLCHTGAHKMNNVLGQILLAKRMGKPRVIAETGAGQHGVATATGAALLGLRCEVFMGSEDVRRQAPNVRRMQLLGAQVHAVEAGSRTLKDAMNEAMRDWVTHVEDTYYCVGTVAGPHPYPAIVREFQRVISIEAKQQIVAATGKLPTAVVACVGGGSNALGAFAEFIPHPEVRLFGVEAGGDGVETGRHAATLGAGKRGVLHGMHSYVLQDAGGQIMETHSISAGLDYPSVGPEHAFLKDSGRAEYHAVTDREALNGFRQLCREEGIIPALESSHAIAFLPRLSDKLPKDSHVVVCLSGRGDKDLQTVLAIFDAEREEKR